MNGTTVLDDIGVLVTNDPSQGDGLLGVVRDAAVVFRDGEILEVTRAGAMADVRIDAEGLCVIPGFVDSHTHLVFAGERGDEFAARMAGGSYSPGGIHHTVEATRAASDDQLRAGMMKRWREARAGGTTTIEIKSGYGLTVEHEVRCLRIARELTPETTFLGAHVVPREYQGRESEYVDLVRGPMLNAALAHARWADVFCEEGAFDAEQCGAILAAAGSAGLGLRLHGNQLRHGPGVQLAVKLGCASVDHCVFLTDDDIAALAASDTVATFLPAADFSTRGKYPDARRVLDAGALVAIASNCNPGSSYTTSMPFCIALAVREMGMTVEEALQAATLGGAFALRRVDVGRIAPGYRAQMVILDAPSYTHLAYRPGMGLVKQVIG